MSGRWGSNERARVARREEQRAAAVAAQSTQQEQSTKQAQQVSQTQTLQQNSSRTQVVQLDGLVLLKMINHSKESMPDVVSGQLLGLDIGSRLEVTNSFPFPLGQNESDSDAYQLDMMKMLRTVNVDINTVGWYQSAYLGSFFDQGLLDAQYTYQKHIPNSVVIIYDPFQTSKGRLVLRAYRLTDEFMRIYGEHKSAGSAHATPKFNYEEWSSLGYDSSDIFQQVPIKVHNSHLVHGFLYELREDKQLFNCHSDRIQVNHSNFLEKNLQILSQCIDSYSNEQSKFNFFQRNYLRTKQAQQDYLKKRESENAARIASGKERLPEEDLSKNPLFRPINKPSRLETYLLSNQIGHYATQLTDTATQALHKLYMIEAINKDQSKDAQSSQQAQAE